MLPPKHCNINLTGPIPRWDEAIPLGNGILGSLFWGPMEHLRISVDIAGLWLRRRPEEKLDKEFTYAKLVELARKGDVAETRRIFDTPYARPTPTKIPAGHLFLDGLPQGSYQASLDLGTAVASFSQKGTTILRAFLCMGRPVGVLMLPEAYRDAELTVERPSFGNGTQAAEAGNSVSPGSLQQLALPDAIPETEDGMIGFSQKVDDRTAYTLLCKKFGTTLYYTAVQAENSRKSKPTGELELCAAKTWAPRSCCNSINAGGSNTGAKAVCSCRMKHSNSFGTAPITFWQLVPSRAMPRCRCKGYGARMTINSHRGKVITTTTSTPNSPTVTI